jgi:hypothetical protein
VRPSTSLALADLRHPSLPYARCPSFPIAVADLPPDRQHRIRVAALYTWPPFALFLGRRGGLEVAAMEVPAAVLLPGGRREDMPSPLLHAPLSSAGQSTTRPGAEEHPRPLIPGLAWNGRSTGAGAGGAS